MHSCKKCLHCECRKSNKSGQKFYYCGHPDQKYIQGYFKETLIKSSHYAANMV